MYTYSLYPLLSFTVDLAETVKKKLQSPCFTYLYETRQTAQSQHISPQRGLSEQWSMIECALGQQWVALFQPKWGYLYNMSSDEAGTAACGIPYPELPF